jgi:hypothetical protein
MPDTTLGNTAVFGLLLSVILHAHGIHVFRAIVGGDDGAIIFPRGVQKTRVDRALEDFLRLGFKLEKEYFRDPYLVTFYSGRFLPALHPYTHEIVWLWSPRIGRVMGKGFHKLTSSEGTPEGWLGAVCDAYLVDWSHVPVLHALALRLHTLAGTARRPVKVDLGNAPRPHHAYLPHPDSRLLTAAAYGIGIRDLDELALHLSSLPSLYSATEHPIATLMALHDAGATEVDVAAHT